MIFSKIVLPGKPQPLKRPRFSIKSGNTRVCKAYNSQSKEMYNLAFIVAHQWKHKCGQHFPLEGPVQLDVTFFMPIPKSLSKKKKDSLDGEFHTKKVDLDNLFKLVADVLTRALVYEDDSQVAVVNTEKVYSSEPRTEITIIKLSGEL